MAENGGYVNPDVLVTTDWVAQHGNDPGMRSSSRTKTCCSTSIGHVPGAVKIDWHDDLQDPHRPRLHRHGRVRRS